MNQEIFPSIQEWQDLYNAAIKFKEIECWDWMYDTDIFGVQNSENKEIGYCCVIGNLGEAFGLAVYSGMEGLEGYLKTQSGDVVPEDYDALHTNKCLLASFDNREYLQKQDLDVIKSLGLQFKGKNAWPLFRNYEPGYCPWYLTSGEARFLTLALQQAIEVTQRFKTNPKNFTTGPNKDYYFTRVFEDAIWKDQWIKPISIKKIQEEDTVIDYARLDRIRERITRKNGVWEIDFFYLPEPVMEKGARPYYPYVFLWVEHNSGFILSFHITPQSKYKKEIPEQFLDIIERNKVLPEEIMTKKQESFNLFKPMTDRLGIGLKKVNHLRALEEAKAGMVESLGGRVCPDHYNERREYEKAIDLCIKLNYIINYSPFNYTDPEEEKVFKDLIKKRELRHFLYNKINMEESNITYYMGRARILIEYKRHKDAKQILNQTLDYSKRNNFNIELINIIEKELENIE